MKHTLSVLAIVCLSAFIFMGGCIQNITTIKFDYNSEVTFITDSLTTMGPQIFGSSVDSSELMAEIEKNGTTLDNIDELKLKSATIAYTLPDSTKNFDAIESFELWISTTGLPSVKVASKNPVLDGTFIVKFDINSTENLLNYVKATSFSYEVKGVNSKQLPPLDLKVNAVFEIKASAKD